MKLCCVCGNRENDDITTCSNCENNDLRKITEESIGYGQFSGKYELNEFEIEMLKNKDVIKNYEYKRLNMTTKCKKCNGYIPDLIFNNEIDKNDCKNHIHPPKNYSNIKNVKKS